MKRTNSDLEDIAFIKAKLKKIDSSNDTRTNNSEFNDNENCNITDNNNSTTDAAFDQILNHYNLNLPVDYNEIFDTNSIWFSRLVKPNFLPKNFLPYKIESHLDQSEFICHIIINLYIAISTLDIQGLISISNKDLSNLTKNLNDFIINNNNHSSSLSNCTTNSTPISSQSNNTSNNNNTSEIDLDIANFDESENFQIENNEELDIDSQFNDNIFFDINNSDININGKITNHSNSIINVNHWTNELKNCLNFPIPLKLRKSLVIVYYHLSLVQGQKIYRQLHVETLENLVNTNDMGTNFTKLLIEKEDLTLDDNLLFDFLLEFLPYPNSDYIRYDIQSKEDLQLFRLLLKLSHIVRPFFTKFEDNGKFKLMEKMNILISSLAPATMSIVLPIITSFIPFHFNLSNNLLYTSNKTNPQGQYKKNNLLHDKINGNILNYFPFCFSIWTSVSPNVAVDTHIYDFVGSVSESFYINFFLHDNDSEITNVEPSPESIARFNQYGILTEDQMTFLFNRLQGHLRADGQIHSFSRTVKPFIFNINGSQNEFFFQQFNRLNKSIETFIHPSNNGFWTKYIAKFIHSFIKMYHCRVKLEEEYLNKIKKLKKDNTDYNVENDPSFSMFLNKDCHNKLIEIVLNTLVVGSQNKNSDIANFYISSFAYLLDFDSSNSFMIMDKILIDIYDSLVDHYINSRHRIIASLKQFTRIIRFMTMDKFYRVHITNILSMLVSKIDLNDLNLTSNLINGIVSIGTFVPFESGVEEPSDITFENNTLSFINEHFCHLKNAKCTKDFHCDDETLNDAFLGSTTIFKNILRAYIDKLFLLVDVELEESFATKVSQTTMILIEAMDDNVFNYFADTFIKFYWENDNFKEKSPNYEIVTIALSAIVKRNNSLAKKLVQNLFLNIKQQIQGGAGSLRSSSEVQKRDIKLVLYLNTLNDVVRQSHEALLEFSEELTEFLKYLYLSITNPPLDVITSILIHSTLATLTTTEIIEARIIEPNFNIPLSEKWGGLQFDKRRYDLANTNFQWHVPAKEEVSTAINLFESTIEWCISNIEKLLETPQFDTAYSDKVQKFILIITHALSGASLLFDPEFTENKLKVNNLGSDLPAESRDLIMKNFNSVIWDDDKLFVDMEPKRPKSSGKSNFSRETSVRWADKLIEIKTNNSSREALAIDSYNAGTDTASEMPSGLVTPNFDRSTNEENDDEEESISPFSFGELDIFTSNYYFGNTVHERLQHRQYFEIHKIRLRVGSFFHKVYEFLQKYHESNTIMNQILLHAIKVIFNDVGQEVIFNDDSNAFIDGEFLDNIQTLAHLDEPFTRSMFAVKVHDYHQDRILFHSSSRFPSTLETQLLKDVLLMSISIYPDVSEPAQLTLTQCMKQIIGSYSFVVGHLIKALEENLKNNNHKKIQAILKVLFIKKIRRKLMSDYKTMKKIVMLSIECLQINELDVSVAAEKLLNEYVSGLKIPSSICVHNSKMYTAIDPCNESVSNHVKNVKTAKEEKRKHYIHLIEELQDSLVEFLNSNSKINWKLSMIVMRLISRIQSSLETVPSPKTITAIFGQTKHKHPDTFNLAARSFLSICNKIFSLSDYGYDISRAFQGDYDPPYVFEVDTSTDNFDAEFKAEMNNFKNPKFFIDSHPYVGWLTWGKAMKVNTPGTIDIELRTNEILMLKKLGEIITKEWLTDFVTTLIQDNEDNSVFSVGDVSFFILLMILVTKGYADNFTITDLFEICERLYVKSDKASTIMSIQFLASLLCGGKYLKTDDLKKRDEFIERFVANCLNDELSQDCFEIWSTLFWWLPTLFDIRRCEPLYDILSDTDALFNSSKSSSAHQASRIVMLKNILLGSSFRSPDARKLLNNLVFDHESDQVRDSVAKLFVVIVQNECHQSVKSADELIRQEFDSPNEDANLGLPLKGATDRIDAIIKRQFKIIRQEFAKCKDLTPQEMLKTKYFYNASTMFYWVEEMAHDANKIILMPYLVDYIIPFLMNLLVQKDLYSLADLDCATLYLALAYIPIRDNTMKDMINLMCNDNSFQDVNGGQISSYQIKLQLSFIQHFLSSHLLQMSVSQREQILQFVVSHIYNEQYMEVRDRAADVLSDIVHNIEDTTKLTELVNQFADKLDGFTWEQKQALSKTDKTIHGSVMGLGAIILAFPYVFPLPRWIPQQLSHLSSWARTSGIAGASAKNTIAEFKKVRTDTWQFDIKHFTSDELEDLEGVLWRSYYA